ncbi:rhomboid family intramembrane serine protease [Spongiibacter sp. KMU-158]|uniref:Rhomboid family intramembrane serine protease n=1 Tax=Spongiibacter pelagi TaxID=2760804 RepID=A0A927C2T7_9GAMM|nr:rhomboid family intramembrane serine protease [Spongiibacter pelagi]MBD2858982.1 rhomboid family intramembrane serine protease [Spongiibacter pelagi]
MPDYIRLGFPLERDLAAFSEFLWRQRIPHRIAEEEGRQVLWIGSEAHAEQVKHWLQEMERGELVLDKRDGAPQGISLLGRLFSSPAVAVLLLLSVVGAALPFLDTRGQLLPSLTFYPFSPYTGEVQAVWPLAEPWRILSPIFLHFGLLHIAFNGLWLWLLGGMIEQRQGVVRLLGVVLLVGATSNIAQAMMSLVIFGGMSGVIYGLLGYMLAWNRLRPQQQFPLQPALAWFMIGWLLLCMVGLASALGLGDIANTAHASGLLMGLLLGFVAALLDQQPDR